MQARFVTLHRNDPQFSDYISGKFSQTETAVPIGSFNIHQNTSTVTFKIVPKSAATKAPMWRVIWRGLRPRLLTMTVTPIILGTLIALHLGSQVDWYLAGLSFASLILLHFSVFLLNDYYDHLKGRDQINKRQGSRIIQNGWASARTVRNWGFTHLAAGAVIALPVIWSRPLFVGGIGLFAALVILAYSRAHQGLKDLGLGEILVSLCLGPLLAVGYSFAITNHFHIDIFGVGLVFGWMASLIFQLKNLEEMVTTYQNRSGGLIQRLGFDRAKRFISWQLVLLPFFALGSFQFLNLWVLLSFATIPLFLTCFWLERRLRRAESPMSSSLSGLWRDMAAIHFKNAVFFAIMIAPAF